VVEYDAEDHMEAVNGWSCKGYVHRTVISRYGITSDRLRACRVSV